MKKMISDKAIDPLLAEPITTKAQLHSVLGHLGIQQWMKTKARAFTGNADDAMDVVQNTCRSILSSQSLLPIRSPKAYFLDSLRKKSASLWRDKRRHTGADVNVDILPGYASPEDEAMAERQSGSLRTYIHELAPTLREVFVRKLKGMKRQKIADELGISGNAVEQRTTRGFTALKSKLDGYIP
jgi:RNA polymerase sigma factor (sigma-70 family)